jgi:hypothetical protein
MYIKHLIVGLLFLVVVKSTTEDTMTWKASRRLTWTDFKANPNQDSDAVALTASGITFGYSLKTSGERIMDFSTSVEAHFYPNKSWYLQEKGNAYILGHEQLHFDITELHARMFREQLAQLVVNQNVKEQMQRLHTAINEVLAETQKRYDAQSKHSMDIAAQKKWEAFIQEELKKFHEYKSQ